MNIFGIMDQFQGKGFSEIQKRRGGEDLETTGMEQFFIRVIFAHTGEKQDGG